MKISEEEFAARRKSRQSLSPKQQTDYDLDLLDAAAKGERDYVYGCLVRGADPNVRDAKGNTPLILAGRAGHTGTVHTLLEGWADPDLENNAGDTALDLAIEGRYRRTVEALASYQESLTPKMRKLCEDIARGAPMKISSRERERRRRIRKALSTRMRAKLDHDLLEAAAYGYGRDAMACLAQGANPDTRDAHGNTPLMLASMAGHTATVHELLEAWARPNLKNEAGKTALILAIDGGHIKTVLAIRNHQPTITEAMRLAAIEAGERARALGPMGADTYRWVRDNLDPK